MATLLSIHSSMFNSGGQSSVLADRFAERWLARNPQGKIISRDLSADPVPHLDAERFQAFLTAANERTPAQRQVVAYSDALIDELKNADVIILGVPMYNFSVPSVLRAYFDHIARAGVTFHYTANGPEGLIKGKKAYVFITRGGVYGEEHSQTSYLRQFLGFIGITDVEFVHAEGLALNESVKLGNLAAAGEKIAQLLAA
ncbi:MAG TPA: FMN-dependent NADH-azoreductase [Gammaproteobacteria bacterium]|jgi:FMN-dependent NADH-azoreductase